MNYDEALDYIHSPKYHGMRLGLDNIRELMTKLGNPQKRLKFIHIAGTNGKGSVASYLSHILTKAGYKTGLFTSPYIERFNERIQVNHEEIPDQSLGNITKLVKEKVESMREAPTEFEIITAIALTYFHKMDCDIVVLEVGLGGKLDSTNVIGPPLMSVITPIGYDHQAILGETLTEIAGEKAGIIKEGSTTVLYPQDKEAEEVIVQTALLKNNEVIKPDLRSLTPVLSDLNGQVFHYQTYKNLKIRLLGHHQLKNAAVVVEAVQLLNKLRFPVSEEALRDGLAETKWPGRFEVISKQPTIVIDGAHNIDSIRALVDNLTKHFSNRRIVAILGILRDKDARQMVEAVLPVIDSFITVTPDNPRAMDAGNLAGYIEEYGVPTIASDSYDQAIQMAIKQVNNHDVICAFGSLYYIGAIRSRITSGKFFINRNEALNDG
ncbi:bifunctional folylpolyglutamate synthase/dihydrofolate synthase [Oceanobacillus senegalensis]|uniref:bifunctional folylpolyglutamate synthase/dihydrofolate synthase n=1 Tax=Oceanobacillus senegalensis TaxID=1936063 RepID=UPI000A30559F|nr:folylpolyglutamate synthase/dihydrofolate synthase family protein [Oceanobacillus senegalensis]